MTTAEKIAAIQKEEYGNYEGRLMEQLSAAHAYLRKMLGDDRFLQLLEDGAKKYPRPKYILPNLQSIKS